KGLRLMGLPSILACCLKMRPRIDRRIKTRSGGSGHELPLPRLQALAAENPHRGKRLLHQGGLELLRLHEELLQAAEHLDRGPAGLLGGVLMSSPAVPRAVMRVASRKFCAAVRGLHTPTAPQMTQTQMQLILPIDSAGPVRI